jgi:hypothetical protein
MTGFLSSLLLITLPLTPPVRISHTPGPTEIGLTHRNVRVDSGGTVWVAAQDRSGPAYRILLFRWDGNSEQVDTVSLGPSDSKWPSLTRVHDSLVVVWHDYRVAGIQNVELFGRSRSLVDGGWSPEVRITYTHAGNGGDNSYVPTVWSNGDTLRLVWYDFRENPARASVYFKQRAMGSAWDSLGDVRVNADTSGQAWFPAVESEPGGFTVFWSDDRTGWPQIRARSYREGMGWAPSQPWAPSPSAQTYPAAARCGGLRAAVWEEQGIRGKAEGGPVVVFASTGRHPDLVSTGPGCWVVWEEPQALAGILWFPPADRVDSFYLPRPAPLASGSGYAGPDAVISPEGGLYLVWAETLPDEPGNTDLFLAVSTSLSVVPPERAPAPGFTLRYRSRGWEIHVSEREPVILRDISGRVFRIFRTSLLPYPSPAGIWWVCLRARCVRAISPGGTP